MVWCRTEFFTGEVTSSTPYILYTYNSRVAEWGKVFLAWGRRLLSNVLYDVWLLWLAYRDIYNILYSTYNAYIYLSERVVEAVMECGGGGNDVSA